MVRVFAAVAVLAFCGGTSWAGEDLSEFEVQREDTFEFAEKPTVTRDGDNWTIRFKTTAFCDVTVAVEDSTGRILRHLGSGVLGKNAPPPFRQNSLEQTLVWDGKNEQGEYIDDIGDMTVRVSLGLKPRFERSLLWAPYRRSSRHPSLMTASPEGVYVFDGQGMDHLRLFDREGNYIRTIYPWPAERIREVEELEWYDFPQLDSPKPLKRNAYRNTLLTAGRNGGHAFSCTSQDGWTARAANAMAVGGGRIALADERLNWLADATADDGPAGSVRGPDTGLEVDESARRAVHRLVPAVAAFSPDGTRLYLTGYYQLRGLFGRYTPTYRGEVYVLDVTGDDPPRLFIGPESEGDPLEMPTSIACDSEGRIYVTDHAKDVVRVFSPDGSPLAEISVEKPSLVRVHPETGEIFVASYRHPIEHNSRLEVKPRLIHLGPLDDPAVRHTYDIPNIRESQDWFGNYYSGAGLTTRVEIDLHADPPMVWVSPEIQAGTYDRTAIERGHSRDSSADIQVWAVEDGELVARADFGEINRGTPGLARRPIAHSRYLYAHPVTGRLVAAGARRVNPRRATWVEIDPETGRSRKVSLPHENTQDIAFDYKGRAYGRVRCSESGGDLIVRFDWETEREIPWDYGQEGRTDSGEIIAGLPLGRDTWWTMQNGFAVGPRGDIAAFWLRAPRARARDEEETAYEEQRWEPRIYPGRPQAHVITIWDRHGQPVHKDAVPGVSLVSGLGIDAAGDVTVMANISRNLPDVVRSCTLMKFTPGEGRFLTAGRPIVALPEGRRPDRPQDLAGHWVENAHWFYGGVGWTNSGHIHCMCWHSRFALDYFGRSFAPEPDLFRVAVLDSSGNLILRVGRYGNVDDGMPLVKEGGPPNPRSIGGDEVALFQPNYVGVHTDRRLFIDDAGNSRIVSVKLGYHTEETIALRDVEDKDAGRPTEPMAD